MKIFFTRTQKIILIVLGFIIFLLISLLFIIVNNYSRFNGNYWDIPNSIEIERSNKFFLENVKKLRKYKLAYKEGEKEIIFYDDYGKNIKFFHWKRNGKQNLKEDFGTLNQISLKGYLDQLLTNEYYPIFKGEDVFQRLNFFTYYVGTNREECKSTNNYNESCWNTNKMVSLYGPLYNRLKYFDNIYSGYGDIETINGKQAVPIYYQQYTGGNFYDEVKIGN